MDRIKWLCAIVTGCFCFPSGLEAKETLEYTVRFPQAQNHLVEIDIAIPTGNQPHLELMMAVWTPGSYFVREYARHVEDISAFDGEKNPLPIEKIKKNRWQVTTNAAAVIHIRYHLYCREMSVRTNWVDHEFAILNGAPTFITVPEYLSHPHHVQLELPDHWQQSITTLNRPDEASAHAYRATNFDELVDSPILCGNPTVYPFEVGGKEHLLVNQGEQGLWDGVAAANDVAQIVATEQRLWGNVPYERYIFFNLLVETRGGLEHDNSTLMMTSRWNFRSRKDYLGWLGLVSHEFFHTWNIRRLRPQALLQYDYENENYTTSLWIAEGITSYYDDLVLARSGICSEKEYFGLLSKSIESLQTKPGRLVQSLRDSSQDAWIKFYRPDENSHNARTSYYVKGAVVAFLLDAKIRQVTDGAKSLDDAIRLLYQRHSGDRGYLPGDFQIIASEVANQDLSAWFQHAIDSTQELDFREAFEWYGLEFKTDGQKEQEKLAQDTLDKQAIKRKVWLGLTTKNDSGILKVERVLRNSPGYRAGCNPGDEIIAIDNLRVSPPTWQSRLEQFEVGERKELLISRRGRLLRLTIEFAKEPRSKWTIQALPEATDDQKKRVSGWIGSSNPME